MFDAIEFSDLQDRIQQHNALTEKYRGQIEALRSSVEVDAAIWEVLLRSMLAPTIGGVEADTPEDETLQTVALDFGFECMGVGAVLAINALAQEDIVI